MVNAHIGPSQSRLTTLCTFPHLLHHGILEEKCSNGPELMRFVLIRFLIILGVFRFVQKLKSPLSELGLISSMGFVFVSLEPWEGVGLRTRRKGSLNRFVLGCSQVIFDA